MFVDTWPTSFEDVDNIEERELPVSRTHTSLHITFRWDFRLNYVKQEKFAAEPRWKVLRTGRPQPSGTFSRPERGVIYILFRCGHSTASSRDTIGQIMQQPGPPWPCDGCRYSRALRLKFRKRTFSLRLLRRPALHGKSDVFMQHRESRSAAQKDSVCFMCVQKFIMQRKGVQTWTLE